MSRFKE